jgi:hypothetical protein
MNATGTLIDTKIGTGIDTGIDTGPIRDRTQDIRTGQSRRGMTGNSLRSLRAGDGDTGDRNY